MKVSTPSQQCAKPNLGAHYEKMNHEFPRVDVVLEKYGYRVDGEHGIKVLCELINLKSTDYFEDKRERIGFIEFSDVRRQFNRKLGEVEVLRRAKFPDDRNGKRISSDVYDGHLRLVRQEVTEKFKDTLHILNEVRERYESPPHSFYEKPHAVLVLAPACDEDYCQRDEVARLLDSLKNHLVMNLPDGLFQKVHVLDVNEYAAA